MSDRTGDSAVEIRVSDPAATAWLELNDLGNAERLKARADGRLCWVPEWGWMAYDGQRWSARDGERLANLLAHEVARSLRDEMEVLAQYADDRSALQAKWSWCTKDMAEDRITAIGKWMIQSGNANKTGAMLAQAKNLLTVSTDRFDREPFALNLQNGTLRMQERDGLGGKEIGFRLSPHDPSDHFTRVCEVAYDPDALAPKWRGHLDKVLPIKEVRDFYQEAVGYGFSGITIEQLVFFLQGKGGDGKSTCQITLRNMAGDYGQSPDVKTFLEGPDRNGSEASPDLFRLQGDTRFISTSEPKRSKALAEDRIKALTGDGRISARTLNSPLIVEFEPKGKLFLECNSKPRISGDDDGIWRRVIVIPFPVQISKAERVLGFHGQLREEFAGILNWVLEGWARWRVRGHLSPPQEILDAVEDYRRSANPFGEWFNARVDVSDPAAVTPSAELFADYKAWCEANDVGEREVMGSTPFGRALGDRQIIKKGLDSKGRVLRRGGKLRAAGEVGTFGVTAGSVDWSEDDGDAWPL